MVIHFKEVIGYKAEPSYNTFNKGDTGFLQTEYVLQLPYFDTTIDTLCHLITGSKSLILVLQGKDMGEEEDHDNLYSTYSN